MVIIGVPKKHGKGISKYVVSAVICLVIYRHSEGQFKVPRIYEIGEILVQLIMLEKCMKTWWRHQMETFSALLAICAGNSPVTGKFPAQRPVTRSFGVFFYLRPNKRLSKQS